MRQRIDLAKLVRMEKQIIKMMAALVFSGLFTTGCIPQMENVGSGETLVNGAAAEGLLSTTSTGSQALGDLQQLRGQGYQVQYQSLNSGELQSLNGHSGGGYKIVGSSITIYLNNSLTSTSEQTHVIAHELVHIKDDLETDQYLRSFPYVATASQNFVSNYKTQGVDSFDSRVVSYVLGTLFCTEARAYTRNQQLANENMTTSTFAKGAYLPQFIDQNYIQKFGKSYGASASAMTNWCLTNSSMTQIQRQLIW